MPPPSQPTALLEDALGNPPFPWQRRLLDHLIANQLPESLDLPTGLGKTSVITIWLVARACGAHHLPRRLVYVVDRRAVVDQATAEAERLRQWARHPPIQRALELGEHPLPVSTLRGQFVDNRAWLEDPSRPAIVVGTVDMLGSRLLFEGYACSRKMRPYHAGMLGCDTWFVLDEAHLVPPFEQMLHQVHNHAAWRPTAVVPPLRTLSLSATGRQGGGKPFRLAPEDHAHPIVRQRVQAAKWAQIVPLASGTKLPQALAAEAWRLAEASESPARIIVFSTKRDDAEAAQRALDKLARKARGTKAAPPATGLFVGGRRVRERREAEHTLRQMGFLAGGEPPVDHAFLFATSAGEVGVDLSADHAVADIVAWERMVQRLGRVNRRGEGNASIVFIEESDNQWNPPVQNLLSHLPQGPDGRFDFSIQALMDLRQHHADAVDRASTPEPLFPALTLPLLDAWSMTSLDAHTGRPEVRPWLRGWTDDPPQTTVVWRQVFPPHEASRRVWTAFFEAAPVHTSERLDAESFRVAAWCSARARNTELEADEVVAWCLSASGDLEASFTTGELARAKAQPGIKQLTRRLMGRILVVDARLGGLSPEGLLDDGANTAPLTGEVGAADWLTTSEGGPPVPFRVRESAEDEATNEAGWRERFRIPLESNHDEDVVRWLVVEKWRHDAATEDDRSAGRPQSLVEHQSWVEDTLAQIAGKLDLSSSLTTALCIAGRLHDEGKRSSRWQRAFCAPSDQVYAKTRGPVHVQVLAGYRHELGSLAYVQADPAFQSLTLDLQDLVLHLVVAHHGFGRPIIRTDGCDDAPPSVMQARAQEIALRFVRLQRTWGPWGLAWLETLLRAADQAASRANDEQGDAP